MITSDTAGDLVSTATALSMDDLGESLRYSDESIKGGLTQSSAF
jgi:hypothetical protein